MTRILMSVLLLVGMSRAAPGQAAKPLLGESDAKNLATLVAEYFAARIGAAEDIREQKNMIKVFEKIRGELPKLAKKVKVETLLASPADLRLAFSAPVHPTANVRKGAYTETENGAREGYKFLLQVPKSYAGGHTTPYPLLLVLHPPLTKADDVKKWVQTAIPAAVAEAAFVVVPLNTELQTAWAGEVGRELAITAVSSVWREHWVDRMRLFLYGEGDSASAAVEYVTAFPGIFAGAAMRGLGPNLRTDKLVNARYVPLLLLADAGQKNEAFDGFVEQSKALGLTTTVQEFAADDKGNPSEAVAQAMAGFVTATVKDVAPQQIRFVTDNRSFINCYWLTIDDVDIPSGKVVEVQAEVIRAENEIRVTTPPEVRAFRVFLNDDVVDMGKTIKLRHIVGTGEDAKSEIRFEGTKERSLEKALDFYFRLVAGNLAEVYTNEIEVTVSS